MDGKEDRNVNDVKRVVVPAVVIHDPQRANAYCKWGRSKP